MLDCVSSSYSQHSCIGGWPDQALQWADKTGHTSDASYPYKSSKGSCSTQRALVNIDGYITLADSLNDVPGNTVTLLTVSLLQLLTYKLQSCGALPSTTQPADKACDSESMCLTKSACDTILVSQAVSNQPVVATMRAETSFEGFYQGGSVWK